MQLVNENIVPVIIILKKKKRLRHSGIYLSTEIQNWYSLNFEFKIFLSSELLHFVRYELYKLFEIILNTDYTWCKRRIIYFISLQVYFLSLRFSGIIFVEFVLNASAELINEITKIYWNQLLSMSLLIYLQLCLQHLEKFTCPRASATCKSQSYGSI